ncbi:MAG: C10 family peptidase, partial [Bacteroidales bacterium]|nr:C10 family peptidase [Bacteroidales bacterium]
ILTNDNKALLYIFTFDTTGFVIISGDDEVYPVLGYSLENTFTAEELPPALQEWLKSYLDQIAFIRANGMTGGSDISDAWSYYSASPENISGALQKSGGVLPLLTCTWNQDTYYNALCPDDINGPGGKALAGCVATAMGQVMYYYRYPKQGIGSHSYYSYNYGYQSANFGNTTYHWEEMGNQATYSNHLEIAKLLYHLGISVDMDYSPTGSGAYSSNAASALKDYFGYHYALSLKYKNNYSDNDWKALLKSNLDAGHPMYYHGFGSGGHAFNVDGYQNTDYFHFNWGWGGMYNGYFYINTLNPGTSDFTSGQGAIVDFYPGGVYPYGCSPNETITGNSGTIEDGSGPVADYQNNNNCSWLIAPTGLTDYIKLDPIRFETELGTDIVEVYDGGDASAALLCSWSGDTIPPAVQSTGDSVYIRFVTNASIRNRGWLLSYKAVPPVFCTNSQVYTAPTGTISDGSGNYNYNNNTNCKWLIQPPYAKDITISFTQFSLETNKDFLRIYDPSTLPSTLLGTFTGYSLPPDITSTSGKMLIVFVSDQTNSELGWQAVYTSTLDIEDQQASLLRIYPVPARDYLFIDNIPEHTGSYSFSVLDLTGRVLKTVSDITDRSVTITTNNLAEGTYILRYGNNNGIYHRTFIIGH